MKLAVLALALLAAVPFRLGLSKIDFPPTGGKSPALVTLPAPPELSPEGYQLILDYEVGSGRAYYDRFLARPSWPGAASGVTIGVGYDCGYNSAAIILSDWSELEQRGRLAETAGLTSSRAKAKIPSVREIRIAWPHAETVFQRVSVAKFWQICRRTWGPGFDRLHPNAQWALLSLTFNRGPSLVGASRSEMRRIKELIPSRNYAAMADEFRAMCRVWSGRDIEKAMRKRRHAEAALMESARDRRVTHVSQVSRKQQKADSSNPVAPIFLPCGRKDAEGPEWTRRDSFCVTRVTRWGTLRHAGAEKTVSIGGRGVAARYRARRSKADSTLV